LVATRYCGGNFNTGGVWRDADVAACNFTITGRMICLIVQEDVPERIQGLRNISAGSENFELTDIQLITSAINTTTDAASGNFTLTESYLQVVNNIIKASTSILEISQREANSSSILLNGVNFVTDGIPVSNLSEPVVIILSSFAVGAVVYNTSNNISDSLTSFASLNETGSINFDITDKENQIVNNSLAKITLPLRNILGKVEKKDVNDTRKITTAVYLNNHLFLERSNDSIVGSYQIISASVVNATVSNINDPPVYITFDINTNTSSDENYTLTCKFWDQTLDEGYGQWSSDGCNLTNITETHATCECTHLTSFAVILDVSPKERKNPRPVDKFLSAISYIGILISIICLVIVIASYLSIKKIRRSEHGQMLILLCVALLCFYVCFIISVHARPVVVICGMISVLMQYFFLVFMMMMSAEAIDLFIKLVIVIGVKIPHYVIKAALISWITPIFITLFCFAIDYKNYINHFICRPFGVPYYVGWIAPFIALYLFNITIFFIIMLSLIISCIKKKEYSTKDQSFDKKKLLQQFIIAVTLSVLFGLGWGVGLPATQGLGVQVLSDILSAIFIFFTAFHGLFVFLLYCVRNENVRNSWKEVLCLPFNKNQQSTISAVSFSSTKSTKFSSRNTNDSSKTLSSVMIQEPDDANKEENGFDKCEKIDMCHVEVDDSKNEHKTDETSITSSNLSIEPSCNGPDDNNTITDIPNEKVTQL
jgi:hypothetical protein